MGGYHLAIIPDGNRRWAEQRDRIHVAGHRAGAETAEQLPDWVEDRPVDMVTLWGLSVDNAYKRRDRELDRLNSIFQQYAERLCEPDSSVRENHVQVNVVGDTSFLYHKTVEQLERLEAETQTYDTGVDGVFNIALGYDGRWDIVQAANTALEEDGVITREAVETNLALPEIDIVLGYGPDRSHLSHLANWQTGYATLYFPQKHWPDATAQDLDEAVALHEDRSKTQGR